jgi:pimeloyl-ACP methyl ester carboxylesterase
MMRRVKRAGRWAPIVAAIVACATGLSPAARAQERAAPALDAARSILRDVRQIDRSRGVDDTMFVEIGGIKQWVSVRGKDRRNPILLFLHGGPGWSEMPSSWAYQSPWEEYFTVVQWDQRGAGKTRTAAAAGVDATLTSAQLTRDAESLVAYLRQRYDKQKIFVLGHSWGTILGMNLARSHPEWLHAYIGMGQIINMPENERLSYAYALRRAKADNNSVAVKELEDLAPYPRAGGDVTTVMVDRQRKWLTYFGGMTWGRRDMRYEEGAGQLSPDYDDADVVSRDRGERASLAPLWPEVMKTNYDAVTRLAVPTFIFAGRHDHCISSVLADAWLTKLDAPQKRTFWFEHSAHMIQYEEPGQMLMYLVNDIRPIAARAGDVPPNQPETD